MTVKNRSKICIIISLAIFVLALVLTFAGRGVNLGIDFAGGLSMQYDMGKTVAKEDVTAVLNGMGLEAAVTVQGANQDAVNVQVKDISKY